MVAQASYPDWVPRALGRVAIALGVLFAGIGLWQAATHKLFFFAENLEVSNANTDYFRVPRCSAIRASTAGTWCWRWG